MSINILKPIKQTDKRIQQHFAQHNPNKLTYVELLLKWSPLLSLFALDALDKQKDEKLEKHLVDVAAAALLLNAAVLPLKYISGRARPDGKSKSFPSRHTAISFLGAGMLREALQEKHPALSYSGYLLSAGTAVLRLYRNRHWFSDVLTGAVIGVAAVKLSPMLVDKVIARVNVQQAVY